MKELPIIVYAEDDPDDRKLLKEALFEAGVHCQLVETANGRETLMYLRSCKSLKNPPALVLLDLNMPILNGRETLAIMKSEVETENIPTMVFTTSTSPLDREFCEKFKVEMITKPSTPEEFAMVINTLKNYCTADIL